MQYIYITKIVVLVSEPVRGRSRVTELPCFPRKWGGGGGKAPLPGPPPHEVFGDIMVLASPPRPPVDPDDANTLTR